MVYYGKNNGKDRLIEESFEAWDYGPVLPDLYNKVKFFGLNPIEDIFYVESLEKKAHEYIALKESCDHFLNVSAYKLVEMTHRKEGAWWKSYIPKQNIRIDDMYILDEYRMINDGK